MSNMKTCTISEIKQKLHDILLDCSCANDTQSVDFLEYDSRNARENCIFVCIKGTKFDAHQKVSELYQNGINCFVVQDEKVYRDLCQKNANVAVFLVSNTRKALALLSDLFFSSPQNSLTIIAITGTKGKTSTSYMIREILKECGKKVGIIGTNGAYFEDFYRELSNSTPESFTLHSLFAKMKSMGAEYIVMEASSQAVKMDRIYGITFDLAVFTNISPDHIGPDEHEDFEEYLSCKGQIFRQCKMGIVNADDEKCGYILDILKEQNINYATFAMKKGADFKASDPKYIIDNGFKTSFVLNDNQTVKLNVPGKFSIFNSLCACAVGLSLNIDIDNIKSALTKASVLGRVEPVKHPKSNTGILIDYAHNALSMQSLFEAIKEYCPRRTICVFGCGGNRSKLRRYDMGEISGNNATISVITSDNPRFEEPMDIINDILIGIKKTSGQYVVIPDRREAIAYALSIANSDDVVLLAGKGQEMYQEIKGVKYPLDEREIVKNYFDELK